MYKKILPLFNVFGWFGGYGLLVLLLCGWGGTAFFYIIEGPNLMAVMMVPRPAGTFETGTTSPPTSSSWRRHYKVEQPAPVVLAYYEEVLPRWGWSVEREEVDDLFYCLKAQHPLLRTSYIQIVNKRNFSQILDESLVIVGAEVEMTSCKSP